MVAYDEVHLQALCLEKKWFHPSFERRNEGAGNRLELTKLMVVYVLVHEEPETYLLMD